jgi:hypothetical protein
VLGCPWQRCTAHFLREALGHARGEQQPMLAALLRPAAQGALPTRHPTVRSFALEHTLSLFVGNATLTGIQRVWSCPPLLRRV